MDRLLEGYRRFRADTWPGARSRYEDLAQHGQKPETMMIACSDSRVDPAHVFGAGPGEIFVLRTVAALVAPYRPDGAGEHCTGAALEFAVRVLQVQRIVVMGHALCGGVRAMVEGAPPHAREFLEPWIRPGTARLEAHRGPDPDADTLCTCEAEVVRLSVENLSTYPWIAAAVAQGRLGLHGYRFDIHTGVLQRVNRDGLVAVA